jgi:hypothetical protein
VLAAEHPCPYYAPNHWADVPGALLMEILAEHATNAPNHQSTIDIFKGEWLSKLPEDLLSGPAVLFDDERIRWADKIFGINGKRILELGPLEAGHTYMIHRMGAREIVAVEASARAFLKCLIVKEIWKLDRARFLYGDIVQFLDQKEKNFDIIFASGVLYHSMEPLRLLHLIARRTEQCLLWTHYYDKEALNTGMGETLPLRFPGEKVLLEQAGYRCKGHVYVYGDLLGFKGFAGGTNPTSIWLSRDDIIGFLRHVGFCHLELDQETPICPAGPYFTIAARKETPD